MERSFGEDEFKVYPNPAIGPIKVTIPANEQYEQKVAVFDLLGRVIQEIMVAPTSSTTTLPIDLSREKNGVYYLELKSRGKRALQKVVKQDLE